MSASYAERVLDKAQLGSVCQTQTGDCESVAVALSRCFDADGFVAVYEPAESQRATHVAVEIEGVLFDGDGRISRDDLLGRLEGFRVRDFEGIGTREEMFDWFEQECLVKLGVNESFLQWSPEVVEACVNQIERAESELEGR